MPEPTQKSQTTGQKYQQGLPQQQQGGAAGGFQGAAQRMMQQQPSQGLPPTGIQQQLTSLNQGLAAGAQTGAPPAQAPGVGAGSTSLQQLSQSLAQNYGLAVGRGSLVDPQGNFLMTPDQIVAQSGGTETLGSASAKMGYIAEAIQRQQQRGEMKKSEAALQTGLGLVQSRGRGSLAAMQSGFYQGLANLYQNQQHEAADFSYFIEKEERDFQREMMSRAERLQKKKARGAFIGGAIGVVGGMLSGDPLGALAGAGKLGQAAGGTGWF